MDAGAAGETLGAIRTGTAAAGEASGGKVPESDGGGAETASEAVEAYRVKVLAHLHGNEEAVLVGQLGQRVPRSEAVKRAPGLRRMASIFERDRRFLVEGVAHEMTLRAA